jgi:hypothetical protein
MAFASLKNEEMINGLSHLSTLNTQGFHDFGGFTLVDWVYTH